MCLDSGGKNSAISSSSADSRTSTTSRAALIAVAHEARHVGRALETVETLELALNAPQLALPAPAQWIPPCPRCGVSPRPASATASGADPVFTQRSYKRTTWRFELCARIGLQHVRDAGHDLGEHREVVGQLAEHVRRARAIARGLPEHARCSVIRARAQGAHVAELHAARGQVVREEATRVQHAIAERSQALEALATRRVQGLVQQQGERGAPGWSHPDARAWRSRPTGLPNSTPRPRWPRSAACGALGLPSDGRTTASHSRGRCRADPCSWQSSFQGRARAEGYNLRATPGHDAGSVTAQTSKASAKNRHLSSGYGQNCFRATCIATRLSRSLSLPQHSRSTAASRGPRARLFCGGKSPIHIGSLDSTGAAG